MTDILNKGKGTDWLATVFYPLAVILMEAFWVAPWLNWIGTWTGFREQRPVLSLVSVIIVLAVSLIITRIISRRDMSVGWMRLIIIGAGLITLLAVLGIEYADGYAFLSGAWFAHTGTVLGHTFSYPGTVVIALPAVIYLWWRGIGLGQSTSFFRDIYRSFLVGMGMMILLIILWQTSASSVNFTPPTSDLGLYIIAFFFFGLLAIAICHLYVMRGSMPKEDSALTSVWRWLPVMLGVVGVMVLIGFGVASIFTPEIFDSIARGLSSIGDIIGKALEIIMTPILYIVVGIFYAVRWLLSLFTPEKQDMSQNMTAPGGPMFEDIETKSLSPAFTETVKWVIIAVLIGLVIFVLAKAISRFRARRAQEDISETNESLFTWKGFRKDLKELFKNFGKRFERAPGGPIIAFDPEAPGRLDMREIYRRLQWEGKKSGVPRRRYETTAEYARRLERTVPDSIENIPRVKDEVQDIRGMYERVRYGEKTIPETETDRANSVWQSLRAMIRRLRGEG